MFRLFIVATYAKNQISVVEILCTYFNGFLIDFLLVSPPKKPPVGGVSIMPGLGAALKSRKVIDASPSISTDRDVGSRQSGIPHKVSDKERAKSTSLSNLLASDLSTAGDSSTSYITSESKRRSTQEVTGVNDPLVLDVVRATHSYKAEFEDELAFDAGDIIEVLEKQSEDEGWWRGRIKGLLLRFSLLASKYCNSVLVLGLSS